MRFALVSIAAILAATAVFAETEPLSNVSPTLTVAVRYDAPPFAYRRNDEPDAESEMRGYDGFIVGICQKALKDLDVPPPEVRVLGVSVTERFDPINDRTADMLCAPVSITPERLGRYLFSMPVFLSGISFITTPVEVDPNRKENIVGVLGNTTALDRLEDGELQKLFGKQFATAISTSVAGHGLPHKSAIRKLSTYKDAFDMICKGNLVYMLGDIDILAFYSQNGQIGCNTFLSQATISREVLAILFSPDFVFDDTRLVGGIPPRQFFMEFQKSIYSLLQDREKMEKLFKQHFPGMSKSRELDAFFRSFVRFPRSK